MARFPKRPTLLIKTSEDGQLLEGIVSECDALGWRVVNLTFQDIMDYSVLDDSPIGAIIGGRNHTPGPLRKVGVPIVRIWSSNQGNFRSDACLDEDRRAAGRLAADVFAERGFRELGYVAFGPKGPPDELFVGFREQAESVHNASVHLCTVPTRSKNDVWSPKRFVKQVSAWLTERPKPLAIFAYNLTMGTRLLALCERAGLPVPEQVAIACRGNRPIFCRTSPVPLSAIDMNRTEMGRQAVRVVQRLVNGEAPPGEIIHVPVKGFVARRSTDILAVPDAMVARAMRFMWDHIDSPLSADDIAMEVQTSRSTLERAFSRTLGRGIIGELRRKRLEVCKDMLRTTKMPLAAIADAIGLMSRRHLHRVLKDSLGMTPQQYRQSHEPKTS